jgi:signal transduction histidine kinase
LPFSILCCVIISLICSLFFSKAITIPIKHIAQAASKMALLDRAAASHVHSQDEIGALSENVNALYQNLLVTIDNLETEKERVREAERSKVDFLRAASHELKTPVTAVNAMLENMILGVGKYKYYEEYLPKCKEMMDRLHELIRDILDASKLSAVVENETAAEADIADMMLELCSPYQMIAKANGIEFMLDLSGSFCAEVKQKLLGRAISNVLSNAVSYTEAGNRVVVFLQGDAIIIENECTPIPPEHLAHIFEPFYRTEYARDRDTGGNGLGLYITASILDALGTNYRFETMENNRGMRFSVYI